MKQILYIILSIVVMAIKKSSMMKRILRKVLNETLNAFGKNLPKNSRNEVVESLRKALTGKVDSYLVKSFATFTNPKYTPELLIRKDARDWVLKNVVMRNKDMRAAALEAYGGSFKGSKILERYADDVIDDILHIGKQGGKNPIRQLQQIGTEQLRNVGEKGKYPALISIIASLLMTIVSVIPFFWNCTDLRLSVFGASLVFVLGLWFTLKSVKLYNNTDDKSALKVMLSSFVYLPIMQIIYVLDKFLMQ